MNAGQLEFQRMQKPAVPVPCAQIYRPVTLGATVGQIGLDTQDKMFAAVAHQWACPRTLLRFD